VNGHSVPLLVMAGVSEASEPERMVSLARHAITLDLVDRALTVPALRPIVVATNSATLAGELAGRPVIVDHDNPGSRFTLAV